MKRYNILSVVSLFLLIFLVVPSITYAQKKARTRVRAYYQKLDNLNKEIKIILTSGSGKSMQGIAGADILIRSTGGEEPVDLATIQTDAEGVGILQVEDGYIFDYNEDGFIELRASFKGNDTLRASNRKLEFKNLELAVDFEEVDSLRIVKVTAKQDSLGVKSPIEEIEVEIGVQRMHSVLVLEKLETNRKGVVEYELPADIPGDDTGTLNCVIRVFEDNDYGTVTTKAVNNWGTIVDYNHTAIGRSLFGDEAPLWMIIGVIIVLGGAWFHFIWAVIKVWKIKKLAN